MCARISPHKRTGFHPPDELRSERLAPLHATFIAPSILYARNNNLCIYYKGRMLWLESFVKEKKKRQRERERKIRRRMINYACKLLCKSIGRGWEIEGNDGSIFERELFLGGKATFDAELIVSVAHAILSRLIKGGWSIRSLPERRINAPIFLQREVCNTKLL